jgi:DNA-binding beta-propeller fold protein YncE
MALRVAGHIDLPAHATSGGFDHAAIHAGTDRLYVAHTANDAVDVIDCSRQAYVSSISDLAAVAGVLVSEERGLVFTSNRGEDTIGIFPPGGEDSLSKVPVGIRPNGLAFDARRGILLVANVGDPAMPGSFTLSVVDLDLRRMRGAIPVPGRTRWAIYDTRLDRFFVNIADPARIVVVAGGDVPDRIAETYAVPAAGPHGLEIDVNSGRLFCACDEGQLVAMEAVTGRVVGITGLSGAPDVIFLDGALGRLYVAVGDPGVIDVIDIHGMRRLETVSTEPGAHTTALDIRGHRLYVFLPTAHRAAVFVDG